MKLVLINFNCVVTLNFQRSVSSLMRADLAPSAWWAQQPQLARTLEPTPWSLQAPTVTMASSACPGPGRTPIILLRLVSPLVTCLYRKRYKRQASKRADERLSHEVLILYKEFLLPVRHLLIRGNVYWRVEIGRGYFDKREGNYCLC